MEPCYLFAYGTLQFPSIQKEVVGRELEHIKSLNLVGYKFEQVKIDGLFYFGAVEDNMESIMGNVYKIQYDDFEYLDEFETKSYTRTVVEYIADQPVYMYIKS